MPCCRLFDADCSPLVTTHTLSLSNLTPSTTYTYRVLSKDAGGNVAASTNQTFATTAATAPASQTTSVTPIGNWKLDEGFGGSALDSSGNGFNGALTNGPVWTAGRSGSALVFDGVNDYVDLGNPPALQITGGMTLSAWVNPKSTLYNGRIISKGSGPGLRGWSLNVENYNVFEFSVAANTNDAATWVDSTTQVPLNTWTHVVGVFQPGAALRIYVNGVLSGSRTTAVPITQFNPPVNVRIGGRTDGYSFDGIIDEVRVYDRALTAVEIQQLYADPAQTTPAAPSGVTPSTPAFAYNSTGYRRGNTSSGDNNAS